MPRNIPPRAIAARLIAGFVIACTSHISLASVLLDNTANGTAAMSGTGVSFVSTADKYGVKFDIATGQSATLQSIVFYVDGAKTDPLELELWSWSGAVASSLGTQTATASTDSAAYHTFALTAPAFSSLASGSYILSVTSSSFNPFWYQPTSGLAPSAPTSGFSFVEYVETADNGAAWSTPSTVTETSIQLNGTVPAVPEPSTLALCGVGIAACGLARRRRLRARREATRGSARVA